MNKRVVFARIGYMKYYAGQQEGDEKPKRGGSYNTSEIGHEVYNFKPAAGYLYGYFQPYSRSETDKPIILNLGRIDPTAGAADFIDDVLVIFVSPSDLDGQVIIGWYDHATVFRQPQKPTRVMLRGDYRYYLKAKAKDAVLLPEKYRSHHVPRGAGAFGRAHVVYPCDGGGTLRNTESGEYSWIGDAITFVESYDGSNILLNPLDNLEDQIDTMAENEKAATTGQGFQITPELRKKIEDLAVEKAEKYFESLGYKVEYVGNKRSYDLECRKGKDVLRVEVKGTQTDGASVILTPKEVLNAVKHNTALFVLHSIKCFKTGSSYSATGGEPFALNPWLIESHGILKPLSYMYEIQSEEPG